MQTDTRAGNMGIKMYRVYKGTPRTCNICGEKEGRDATSEEVEILKAPVSFGREYENGKWTGKHICSTCDSRITARKRRAETAPIPSNIEECRAKHDIILRIVMGLPACIERGSSKVIHHGIGCNRCTKGKTWK